MTFKQFQATRKRTSNSTSRTVAVGGLLPIGRAGGRATSNRDSTATLLASQHGYTPARLNCHRLDGVKASRGSILLC